MEPGKKYSTVVENTFHLSMATLDLETVKKGMYKAYNLVQLNISLLLLSRLSLNFFLNSQIIHSIEFGLFCSGH